MRPPRLDIRIAETFFTRLRGLILSPPPRPGHGLLIRPCRAVHTAFMRYPLDIVFLDDDARILSVVTSLRPWRMAAARDAAQTLELAAGEAARLGLRPGQSLAHTLYPPGEETLS